MTADYSKMTIEQLLMNIIGQDMIFRLACLLPTS